LLEARITHLEPVIKKKIQSLILSFSLVKVTVVTSNQKKTGSTSLDCSKRSKNTIFESQMLRTDKTFSFLSQLLLAFIDVDSYLWYTKNGSAE